MVLHRHREERLGAVAGLLVEIARAGEIESFGGVGIRDVDRLAGQRGVSGHHAVVRLAVLAHQVDRVERHRRAGGAAEVVRKRGGAHDLEAQRPFLGDAVQRAAVGAGDRLGGGKNALEQAVDVAFGRERCADRIELLEAQAEVFSRLGRGEQPHSLGAFDRRSAHGRPGPALT